MPWAIENAELLRRCAAQPRSCDWWVAQRPPLRKHNEFEVTPYRLRADQKSVVDLMFGPRCPQLSARTTSTRRRSLRWVVQDGRWWVVLIPTWASRLAFWRVRRSERHQR